MAFEGVYKISFQVREKLQHHLRHKTQKWKKKQLNKSGTDKSAPYLDSKKAKAHESVKKLKVSNSQKTQTTELAHQVPARDPLGFFNICKWLRDALPRFYSLYDDALHECGNFAYNIIKCWEALSIGYLIQRGARLGVGLPSEAKFYGITLGDYRAISNLVSKGLLSPATAQKIDVETNHLLTKGDAHPGVLVELFGLYRIWGHPLVNNINGCKKVLNIPHEEGKITIGILQDREHSMKEMWVTHYYLEHNMASLLCN